MESVVFVVKKGQERQFERDLESGKLDRLLGRLLNEGMPELRQKKRHPKKDRRQQDRRRGSGLQDACERLRELAQKGKKMKELAKKKEEEAKVQESKVGGHQAQIFFERFPDGIRVVKLYGFLSRDEIFEKKGPVVGERYISRAYPFMTRNINGSVYISMGLEGEALLECKTYEQKDFDLLCKMTRTCGERFTQIGKEEKERVKAAGQVHVFNV